MHTTELSMYRIHFPQRWKSMFPYWSKNRKENHKETVVQCHGSCLLLRAPFGSDSSEVQSIHRPQQLQIKWPETLWSLVQSTFKNVNVFVSFDGHLPTPEAIISRKRLNHNGPSQRFTQPATSSFDVMGAESARCVGLLLGLCAGDRNGGPQRMALRVAEAFAETPTLEPWDLVDVVCLGKSGQWLGKGWMMISTSRYYICHV